MRRLGVDGPLVGAIGLGCMGMSEMYGPTDDSESARVINAALDAGVTVLDSADMYGAGHNEELVGSAIRHRRDDAFLITKFGIRRDGGRRWNDNSPEYARQACEASLRRLGVDHIDLYFVHRFDGSTPVEDTVAALADLVDAGKVRHIGLSEVSADTLRRAAAVHPVAAVQSEFSLWSRNLVTDGILATARELGIATIAYSPLGRGFLTGTVRDFDVLADNDFRKANPRFTDGNLAANLALLDPVERLADKLEVPTAAVALAWVLAQGDDIIAIPGTKRLRYLAANVEAAALRLDPADVAELTEAFRAEAVAGERYPAAIMPVTR
ncbi:aldo/keto reductase [Actinokineospora inagensis]|uniref:aldo/keto reductase n=1 Tax=Actinokineospora inagensis TaxID=103730 RepID=UPI0024804D7C|nr:aldo/keto reductase [Actinokineospora inagensis]